MFKTQIAAAQCGEITPQIAAVAKAERRSEDWIRERVADGRVVIPANRCHASLNPMGIGRELRTKINANIGTSPTSSCVSQELAKLDAAIRYGADTVMDLSTGDNLDQTRRMIIGHSVIPVGTVPIYELACRCGGDDAIDFSKDAILAVIRDQAEQGVDYMTIHCGINRNTINKFKNKLGIIFLQQHIKNPHKIRWFSLFFSSS